MHAYGLSLHDAVWRFPLHAARWLHRAAMRRQGIPARDQVDDAFTRAANAERRRLNRTFTILPDPKP